MNRNTFSKLSFLFSIITLGLFSYLFLSIPNTIVVGENIGQPSKSTIWSIFILLLIGISMMILSITKKEEHTWYKWIGLILNTTVFILIIGSILFAKLI